MTYVENKRKELKTSYPHEKGLTAKTQSQVGRVMNLMPQTGSTVLKKFRKGL